MTERFWMVRAGEGAYLVEDFLSKGVVGVGWDALTDLSGVKSLEEMRKLVEGAYPGRKPAWVSHSTGMIFKFVRVIKQGDAVVTYDPAKREYILGTIDGPYRFEPGVVPDSAHLRKVNWGARVSRDLLSSSTRNSLGSISTLFEPGEQVHEELKSKSGVAIEPTRSVPASIAPAPELEDEFGRDLQLKAHERIKDQILALDEDELPELVAALLRAMGLRARRGPAGSDRGRDVIASPDGLGLMQPRVVAEVKARPGLTVGAPLVRSFLAALQSGDKGLYVATGGFSKEASYEAERSAVPVTLINLDHLAELIVTNYDKFDMDGQKLFPLNRIYWPVD